MSSEQPKSMNIRIISDGTAMGTRVYGEDGADISHRISAIEWHCDAKTQVATAKITLSAVAVDVSAFADTWEIQTVARHPEPEGVHAS